MRNIKSALISVFHKEGIEPIVKKLDKLGVSIYSTGGTQKFIESCGVRVSSVEEVTSYPSILGGRVKTLHPKVFGGILARRSNKSDNKDMKEFSIPEYDLVIVDLYPFEDTLASGGTEEDLIEKIDIGGVCLMRAAAKNYKDVLIISHRKQYKELLNILEEQDGITDLATRKNFAREAFSVSSNYDAAIFTWYDNGNMSEFRKSYSPQQKLRYGENPHQKGYYFGDFNSMFEQLHGKEISYNNLLDIDAAVSLIEEFKETTLAILKHNNACGIASRDNLCDAWRDAFAGDPISAFGGIIVTNTMVDAETATEINKIFFEVIIAPGYTDEALDFLKQKKNRIILVLKSNLLQTHQFRSVLNGVLLQERDTRIETKENFEYVTETKPDVNTIKDLVFANKIVKNTKSNSIVLVKNGQLCASGVGQTSRIDALKQAIEKANNFKFDLKGAVMASDAFFPFKDSVEIAHQAGIISVIQPGGSIRDEESIEFCNQNEISMVFT
ncbi:MAG TPA: bifunctional phosphoribosylaminoimidazolecarboxamide formyltransferase/IMP cyclohydrolase, partial [Bacteroidales bacterium]|nr:bifunctional phosphoribosylaminoimidazolecarboxamide formyltransferase/IMP cyclohydrolase [Bacteroidales bacterium]